jgi:hypothetical protein
VTTSPVPSSPSTVLRQAAKLMREDAEKGTTDPLAFTAADDLDADAVAADEFVRWCPELPKDDCDCDCEPCRRIRSALAVARAYLGTTEGTETP